MRPPSSGTRGSIRRGAVLVAALVLLRGPAVADRLSCEDRPLAATVITALFRDPAGAAAGSCDLNADGVVAAADITGILSLPPASTCPAAGATVAFAIDNQTGKSSILLTLSGERLGQQCLAGTLATSYRLTIACSGTGVALCGQIGSLAPGTWHHAINLVSPHTGQTQQQATLLVADSVPNPVRFTAFASVLTVRNAANEGAGSLRSVLQNADAAVKPLLIQFDPAAFPAAVPTAIRLSFQLPLLAANDVTIDGTDATGAVGNRIIDAGGLPIGALAITAARNHLIGLYLRNAGVNDRDVLSISGASADANVIEHSVIEDSASADGIGIDGQAGKDFGDTANVIRYCEVRGAADKGVKVTTGSYARVEDSWVHDNANGGIQATLGGHVQATRNLVERNRGSTAQNGLSANAQDDNSAPTGASELNSSGDISRANGANGMSVRALAVARSTDDYLANNGSSGVRVFNDVGPPASAVVEGTSAVCNAVDGAVVANASSADFGGGALGSAGNNAFAQNNLPGGGANLRNATGQPVSAVNDQWEHCGHDLTCDAAAIAAYDLADHAAHTAFVPAQAHRTQQPPVITAVAPPAGRRGELLRIFGSGFNVIDGLFAENQCGDVRGRNRCAPLRGNCVGIDGISAPVEAVTPTMLVVHWPFTCVQPVPLVVTTAFGGTSASFTACTAGASAP